MSLDLDAARRSIDGLAISIGTSIATCQEQTTHSIDQLTSGVEQMTHEIAKLQAVERYVLYKSLTTASLHCSPVYSRGTGPFAVIRTSGVGIAETCSAIRILQACCTADTPLASLSNASTSQPTTKTRSALAPRLTPALVRPLRKWRPVVNGPGPRPFRPALGPTTISTDRGHGIPSLLGALPPSSPHLRNCRP